MPRLLPRLPLHGFQSTLPRREWLLSSHIFPLLYYFNPHSHAGSDFSYGTKGLTVYNFNPHSHAGSDYVAIYLGCFQVYFNPHSHAGSDDAVGRKNGRIQDFNPHSHAGSDGWKPWGIIQGKLFQSTLPRREWHYDLSILTEGERFQSTLPRREWPKSGSIGKTTGQISIHTPTQGVTCKSGCSEIKLIFQSTLPRREWLQISLKI